MEWRSRADLQGMVTSYARENVTNHVLWSLTLGGSFVFLATNMKRLDLCASFSSAWGITRSLASILTLAGLSTLMVYLILRTFLYDAILRCALWLPPVYAPSSEGENLHRIRVRMPRWLRERATRSSYREVDKDLLKNVPFGYPVDYPSDSYWTYEIFDTDFHYLRYMTLAAHNCTRLPFSVEQVEQLFGGSFEWRSYLVPFLLGLAFSLWTYVFLIPVA